MKNADVEEIAIDGSFGDRTVIISELFDTSRAADAPLVILFHGLYGIAGFRPGNKYGDMGRILFGLGADVCIIETSRMRRDRDSFATDSEAWIREAFGGKTYAMELNDACTACNDVIERHPGRRMWLWGFSLGGLLAAAVLADEVPLWLAQNGVVPCGVAAEGLVLAGTSDRLRESARHLSAMPVIDVLRAAPEKEPQPMRHIVPTMNVRRIASFYGSEDDTFTEESCRDMIEWSPLSKDSLRFFVMDGVDHSFNLRHDKPDRSILSEMAEKIADWLFPTQ